MRIRIQKKLAQVGVASRREIERMIEAGRIEVNDKPAEIGQSIGPKDRVKVDGKPLRVEFAQSPTQVLLYHKPQGEIVARHDPEERPIVFDALPDPDNGRWVAVGRLDINTSGLLLLTNNGELAHRLMHPSYEIVRGYAVRVLGEASNEALKQLKAGVELDDGPAKFDSIEANSGTGHDGANHWYHVTLKEGRNREVRRLWEAVGLTVSRLSRVHFDVIQLPRELHRGQVQLATQGQVNRLLERVGLETEKASNAVPNERTDRAGRAERDEPKKPSKGRSAGRPEKGRVNFDRSAKTSSYAQKGAKSGQRQPHRRRPDDRDNTEQDHAGSSYYGNAKPRSNSRNDRRSNDSRSNNSRSTAYSGKSADGKPRKTGQKPVGQHSRKTRDAYDRGPSVRKDRSQRRDE